MLCEHCCVLNKFTNRIRYRHAYISLSHLEPLNSQELIELHSKVWIKVFRRFDEEFKLILWFFASNRTQQFIYLYFDFLFHLFLGSVDMSYKNKIH